MLGAIGGLAVLISLVFFANVFIRLYKHLRKVEGVDVKTTLKRVAIAVGLFIVGGLLLDTADDGVEVASDEIVAKEEKEEEEKEKPEPEKKEKKEYKPKDDAEYEKEKDKEKKKKDEPTLPFTVNEFRERFDDAADEFELTYRSNKSADITKGDVHDTQQVITASDYVNAFATLSKDGGVISISMVGVGDGSDNSGFDILATMGAIIAAAQPELMPEERGVVLKELGLSDGRAEEDMQSTTRDNVKYSLSINELTGVMFFVEPVE